MIEKKYLKTFDFYIPLPFLAILNRYLKQTKIVCKQAIRNDNN